MIPLRKPTTPGFVAALNLLILLPLSGVGCLSKPPPFTPKSQLGHMSAGKA